MDSRLPELGGGFGFTGAVPFALLFPNVPSVQGKCNADGSPWTVKAVYNDFQVCYVVTVNGIADKP